MNKEEKWERYWRVILIVAIASIIVLLLSFMVFFMRSGDDNKKEQKSMTTENPTQTESVSETTQEADQIEDNPLLQDAVPEIKELMEQFYQAKFDCDVETLRQLVSPTDAYTEESLYEERYGREENSLFEIESYQVESCYSKKGLEEGTYLVWVYVDIKYVHADTPAPALFRMYVCTDENGYYIYNGSLEGEIGVYRDEISAKEDVLGLATMVNQRFQEVVNQDEQLKNIVLAMEGTTAEESQISEEFPQAE